MEAVGAAAEHTTAATDAVLALAALAAIVVIRRTPASFGRSVWVAALAALLLASLLGAVAHGLRLSPALREFLWQPLYLSLGVTMALFVVGAVRAGAAIEPGAACFGRCSGSPRYSMGSLG